MRFEELVAVSRVVAETGARLGKTAHLAGLLKRLSPHEVEIAVAFLSGAPRQGRIGVGGSLMAVSRDTAAADAATLDLTDVDDSLGRAAAAAGAGSTAARAQILRDLLRRATRDEQDFIARLIFGELRQGALEGVLIDAVARASGVSASRVRRAAMLAGELGPVARAALVDGDAALDAFLFELFQPVQPMLAQAAATIDSALAELGEASLEYKLDGARIQVHKSGDDVRAYSRNLREVTAAIPEVVEIVRELPAREIVLDGEVIALRSDGTPWPFQVTMRRFGRRLDVESLRRELPLTPVFFDALYLEGQPLLDETLARRVAEVQRILPAQWRVPRIVTARPDEAAAFLGQALAAGHEGVMAKAVGGVYAAGRRGQAWIKVKPARTLDLVVLAAEWGHGRRRGTLSNLHLGAREEVSVPPFPEQPLAEGGARAPSTGYRTPSTEDRVPGSGFIMLGKTFKGMTDEMLAWQTKKLLELEVARDEYTVYVRPELVVEVAFNDLQESPHYAGGLALRFARVKRYRTDKLPLEADTMATVRALYEQMTRRVAPAGR